MSKSITELALLLRVRVTVLREASLIDMTLARSHDCLDRFAGSIIKRVHAVNGGVNIVIVTTQITSLPLSTVVIVA
jgi:hypothetical protein